MFCERPGAEAVRIKHKPPVGGAANHVYPIMGAYLENQPPGRSGGHDGHHQAPGDWRFVAEADVRADGLLPRPV